MKTGHHQADFSVADPISISMVLQLTAAPIANHLQAPLLSQAQNLQVKVRANLAKNIVVPTPVPKQVQQVLEQPAAQLVLTKELNIVSWNDQPPKYDIRDWDEQHERMSRGITLTKQELESVVEAFQNELE